MIQGNLFPELEYHLEQYRSTHADYLLSLVYIIGVGPRSAGRTVPELRARFQAYLRSSSTANEYYTLFQGKIVAGFAVISAYQDHPALELAFLTQSCAADRDRVEALLEQLVAEVIADL